MSQVIHRFGCKLKSYCHYSNARCLLKRYASCLQLQHNLKIKSRFPSNKSISSSIHLHNRDRNVMKYLDYICSEYKSGREIADIPNRVINVCDKKGLLGRRMEIVESIKNLEQLVKDDKEMEKLADEEVVIYKNQLQEVDEKLIDTILSHLDKECYPSIIMQITAGVGGQEAMLFVKDLADMYIGYLNYLEFPYDIIEQDQSEQSGFRNISILVKNEKAFEKLKYEGGVHRVQRIPETERSSRMHTSTATVAILPEPTDIQIKINNADLKIETKRASGAGGQHVNTTDSAIRMIHLPTGTVVTCQTERSQIQNRATALLKLRSILYEKKLSAQLSLTSELRKKQQGMGNRNEKIRTYNFSQNRVTDHRLSENGTVYNLDRFMQGGKDLEQMVENLRNEFQEKVLHELITNFINRRNSK